MMLIWWKALNVSVPHSFAVENKLRALKAKVKVWNKEVFRQNERNKDALK